MFVEECPLQDNVCVVAWCLQLEDYQSVFSAINLSMLLGQDWDLYLVTACALALGVLIVLRRQR